MSEKQVLAELSVDNIRAHAKELTDRLQKEIPKLGTGKVNHRELEKMM